MSGRPIKMIRTRGGFWIAIGHKKGKHSEEALGAGSHPAIVKYNLEKQFPDFEPNLMKSEGFVEPIVEKHSHFLSEDMRKSGHDIFSIQTGTVVEFQITKQNSSIAKVNANVEADNLVLTELNIPKEFTKAMAGAAVEKAVCLKAGLKMKV
jgi:hypothetical protein